MAGSIRILVENGRGKIPKEQLKEITQKTGKAWENAIEKKKENKEWGVTEFVFAKRSNSNALGSITGFYRRHKN